MAEQDFIKAGFTVVAARRAELKSDPPPRTRLVRTVRRFRGFCFRVRRGIAIL